jgi:arylsulfatase
VPGTIVNDIGAHEDVLATVLAAAGDATVKDDLLKGKKYGDKTFTVHRRLQPHAGAQGKAEWPRHEFIYWTDSGSVAALRYNNWQMTFLRQNSIGFKVWETPLEELRWPMLTNLRMDPLERASTNPSATSWGRRSVCSCSRPPVPTSANGCRVSRSLHHV